MKNIITIAAVAAMFTLAACGNNEATLVEYGANETAAATDSANAVDPNLQQICDSQTPTAACDSEEVRNSQYCEREREETRDSGNPIDPKCQEPETK